MLFWDFSFLSFQFCTTAKVESSDLESSKKKKKFRGFRDFRGFWVFGLAQKNNWFLKLYQNIYYMIDFSVNFAVIYSH